MSPERTRVGRRRLLTREQVARAAFELLDAHGADALTIGRLARELGVSPMTLYGYAESKDAIVAMLPELLLADLPTVDPDGSWRDQLECLYRAIYKRFVDHGNVTLAIVEHAVFGRAHAEVIEGVLELLKRAGFTPEDAFALQRTLNTYTLGFGFFALAESRAGDERPRSAWAATLGEATFPRIAEVAPLMRSAVSDEQYARGLRRILES